jgi:hypothetical protein
LDRCRSGDSGFFVEISPAQETRAQFQAAQSIRDDQAERLQEKAILIDFDRRKPLRSSELAGEGTVL